jgi:hypothetical protein
MNKSPNFECVRLLPSVAKHLEKELEIFFRTGSNHSLNELPTVVMEHKTVWPRIPQLWSLTVDQLDSLPFFWIGRGYAPDALVEVTLNVGDPVFIAVPRKHLLSGVKAEQT